MQGSGLFRRRTRLGSGSTSLVQPDINLSTAKASADCKSSPGSARAAAEWLAHALGRRCAIGAATESETEAVAAPETGAGTQSATGRTGRSGGEITAARGWIVSATGAHDSRECAVAAVPPPLAAAAGSTSERAASLAPSLPHLFPSDALPALGISNCSAARLATPAGGTTATAGLTIGSGSGSAGMTATRRAQMIVAATADGGTTAIATASGLTAAATTEAGGTAAAGGERRAMGGGTLSGSAARGPAQQQRGRTRRRCSHPMARPLPRRKRWGWHLCWFWDV